MTFYDSKDLRTWMYLYWNYILIWDNFQFLWCWNFSLKTQVHNLLSDFRNVNNMKDKAFLDVVTCKIWQESIHFVKKNIIWCDLSLFRDLHNQFTVDVKTFSSGKITIQAYLRDTEGLVPDHYKKANTKKVSHTNFLVF